MGGVSISYLLRPQMHSQDQLTGVRIGEAANPGPPNSHPSRKQDEFLQWEMAPPDGEPAPLIAPKERTCPARPVPSLEPLEANRI